jgi:hypothetical protein
MQQGGAEAAHDPGRQAGVAEVLQEVQVLDQGEAVPTAKPRMAASTRKPMRWVRTSATTTSPWRSPRTAADAARIQVELQPRPASIATLAR